MTRLTSLQLRLAGLLMALLMAALTFEATAFAQTQPPAPTRAPSGSNPQIIQPTDIPTEWSLFWVFMFFAALGVGLLFANWLVRRGTFDEPERRI